MHDILNIAGGILFVGFIFGDLIYEYRRRNTDGPIISAKYQFVKIIVFIIMTVLFQSNILSAITALCAIINTMTLYEISKRR